MFPSFFDLVVSYVVEDRVKSLLSAFYALRLNGVAAGRGVNAAGCGSFRLVRFGCRAGPKSCTGGAIGQCLVCPGSGGF